MSKTEKVLKCGIKKEFGWLYFVDKDGDISRFYCSVRGVQK